jgi:hypothetical protein
VKLFTGQFFFEVNLPKLLVSLGSGSFAILLDMRKINVFPKRSDVVTHEVFSL